MHPPTTAHTVETRRATSLQPPACHLRGGTTKQSGYSHESPDRFVPRDDAAVAKQGSKIIM
jgi:hypothetical protein